MATFPSEEWLKLYVERINDSKEYKEAAATFAPKATAAQRHSG